MKDCLFCKIANKEINAKIISETNEWICFEDVNPKAPIHYLIIPKKHFNNFHEVDNPDIYANLLKGIREVVKIADLITSGYRVITNTGPDGGQSISHLHFHIMGKRPMGWPPG
jgi:histidine triad (HIT) family protein